MKGRWGLCIAWLLYDPGTSPNRRHRQNPCGSSTLTTPRRRRWGSNDRHVVKLGNGNVRALRISRAGPVPAGIDLRAELTDSPPGTEEESDDVTECHTSGNHFGGPVPADRALAPRFPRRLHWCTDARNTPPKLPFLPFFGTFGAASRRDGSLGKALRHHEIGHDLCWAGPSQNRVGIGAPKLPHRFPLIVHYLRLLGIAPNTHTWRYGRRSLAVAARTRLTQHSARWRERFLGAY